MTDELKRLKAAFEAEPESKAPAHAKKAAMAAAMQAFENHHEKNNAAEKVKNTQGNANGTRQKEKHSYKADSFTPSFWSKLMKKSYIILPVATAAALAVSVMLFNPQWFSPTGMEMHRDSGILDMMSMSSDESTANSPSSTSAIISESKVREEAPTESRRQRVEEQVVAQAESAKEVMRSDDAAAPAAVAPPPPPPAPKPIGLAKQEVAKAKKDAMPMADKADAEAGRLSVVANEAKPSIQPMSKTVVANTVGATSSHAFGVQSQPIAETEADIVTPPAEQGRDKFNEIKTNRLKSTQTDPVSTFSIDVDTASYSFMRAAIQRNRLPQKDAIRIEELINYFPYDYPAPKDAKQPFQTTTTVMPTPWNKETKLLHIGIKGYQLPKQTQPTSNLVFLLDTSGSMNQANKLPLLKNSFKLLLSTLQPTDTVSIVAYAGSAGTVLEPTKVAEKQKIIQALERLNAGGSTAGGQGIRLAYQLAEANYNKEAVNRVILATDGDFNVGIRNQEELKSFIERKRKSGVFLSVLGFGTGNYNDALMQTLAQNGNGNAAYIDSLSEARKVLVEEASSTLFTIAKDVKIQMEFNPKVVSHYRLIGYETRHLNREDFNNDKVDAGDIGAGHTVTALYELTLANADNKPVDPLRYADKTATTAAPVSDEKQSEYGFLKLRYKLPDEDKSKLIETPIQIADTANAIDDVSGETRFATAVAAFGQLLRGGLYTGVYSYDDVLKLAQASKGDDLFGYRAEFMNLVRLAKTAESGR